MCSIDIPIMKGTTDATRPFSYPQRPQSTRSGLGEADRASDAGAGFVDFAVVHPQPTGLVFQKCAKLMPTGIVDRLGEAGFGEARTGDIANHDQLGAANDLCRFLVRPVLAGVFGLGMDGGDPAFLAGTLRHGQIIFVAAREVFPVVFETIGARRLIFEPQVNADLRFPLGRLRVFDFALDVHVPATTGILRKASGLGFACERTRQPEAKAATEINNRVVLKPKKADLEWHPTERVFAAAPFETAFAELLAACGVFPAYLGDCIRMQPQFLGTASRKVDQVKSAKPTPFSAPRQYRHFITEVPHRVDRPAHTL